MPKNILFTTESDLRNIPLPTHGGKYAVVSHDFIMQTVLNELQTQGFVVEKKIFKSNLNGEVAQGIYHLTYGNDPDIDLMFAWANSYDKSMRFRCAVGAHVKVSGGVLIAGDMSNYGRKHTGDAKDEVEEHIKQQLSNANTYFKGLVADKAVMKNVTLSDQQIAELMGVLYFEKDFITSSQLIQIKDEVAKPTHNYGTSVNSLWTVYNYVTVALKSAHPKKWMEQQKGLHRVVKKLYFPATTPVPAHISPNQTTLDEGISDVNQEKVEIKISEITLEKHGSVKEFSWYVSGSVIHVNYMDEDIEDFSIELDSLIPGMLPTDLDLPEMPGDEAVDNMVPQEEDPITGDPVDEPVEDPEDEEDEDSTHGDVVEHSTEDSEEPIMEEETVPQPGIPAEEVEMSVPEGAEFGTSYPLSEDSGEMVEEEESEPEITQEEIDNDLLGGTPEEESTETVTEEPVPDFATEKESQEEVDPETFAHDTTADAISEHGDQEESITEEESVTEESVEVNNEPGEELVVDETSTEEPMAEEESTTEEPVSEEMESEEGKLELPEFDY